MQLRYSLVKFTFINKELCLQNDQIKCVIWFKMDVVSYKTWCTSKEPVLAPDEVGEGVPDDLPPSSFLLQLLHQLLQPADVLRAVVEMLHSGHIDDVATLEYTARMRTKSAGERVKNTRVRLSPEEGITRRQHANFHQRRSWCEILLCRLYKNPSVLWYRSLCTLYLHDCQVRVTVGDSCLCCCPCVTSFER